MQCTYLLVEALYSSVCLCFTEFLQCNVIIRKHIQLTYQWILCTVDNVLSIHKIFTMK
jgi:hypothetical protein